MSLEQVLNALLIYSTQTSLLPSWLSFFSSAAMRSDFIPHAPETASLCRWILSVFRHLISVVFCLSRPEPPNPGQTNGISTPEQLTGRFQVRVAASICRLFVMITEHQLASWCSEQHAPSLFSSLLGACFMWIMSCFDYTGNAVWFLLMHVWHNCLLPICFIHCPQDGSNIRRCGDLVLVPVLDGDHNESQRSNAKWYRVHRLQTFLLCVSRRPFVSLRKMHR